MMVLTYRCLSYNNSCHVLSNRTFLESEVKNPVLRKDLYEKMIKLNRNEPTAEENEQKAITKLRYMQVSKKKFSANYSQRLTWELSLKILFLIFF